MTLDVSVIVPVRNEASSISPLLDALASQTVQPKEIVIVDGGSEDGTPNHVRAGATKLSVPVVLVEAGPAFPGRARNIAIAQASNNWLATIDGGTIPDRNWLSELTSVAETNPHVRIVYGKYLPVTNSYFTHCAAIAYVPPPNILSPSTASSLLHRSVWTEAGGFREDLRSGEDLLFFKRINQLKVPQACTDQAIVHWSLEPSWAGTFRRFATYSRYGMKAGLGGEWQLRVTLLYLILLTLVMAGVLLWLPLMILPLLFVIFRTERRILRWSSGQRGRWMKVLNPRLVLTVLSINSMIDIAMFYGILQWVMRDVLSNESQMARLPSKS